MTTTTTEPRVLDDQELQRLNGHLRDAHLMLNHRLGRLGALFAQSQPTDHTKLTALQEIFEDIKTTAREGVGIAEQLSDHQRAVEQAEETAA